ncbi:MULTISPECIES: PH domain-containing protein [unclassified Shewanella]|uniref:PH domain-containing protein n=1 Tax=unclassified Shewanella TaxID=196818 RepID=UPI000C860826|nr:PH domain-containing protein [Shewanella sp. 10N.286.48.B5]PMH87276.1 hypothetical protein BCU57_01260 [Shewanella sp. 10N.286.48.B5]
MSATPESDVTVASTSEKLLIAEAKWQSYTEVTLTKVDKNYPKQIFSQSIGLLLLILAALVVVMTLNQALGRNEYLIISGVLIAGVVLTLIRFLAAKKLRYGVLEHEILIRQGLWWIKTTALPYSRLQHVSLSQNPLQRRFNLATIKCFSAGSGAAEIFLPGLSFTLAEKLRQHLLNKASYHQQPLSSDISSDISSNIGSGISSDTSSNISSNLGSDISSNIGSDISSDTSSNISPAINTEKPLTKEAADE